MTNPFTQVYQKIISILQQAPSITGANGVGVAQANIIDLTQATRVQNDPIPEPTTGRTPQLLVLPSGGTLWPIGSNSRVAQANRDFLICITTDTLRIGGELAAPITLFSVEWAIFLAFVPQPNLSLPALVQKCTAIVTHERGALDSFPALARTTPERWTAIMKLTVEMYWGSNVLLTYIDSLSDS